MAFTNTAENNLVSFGKKWTSLTEEERKAVTVPKEVFCPPLAATMEFIFCPICHEYPLEPWQLFCQHTFCSSCLDQLHTRHCPTCRQQTVGTKSVSRFLRAGLEDVLFRCHEPDCLWTGKSLVAVKTHWTTCPLAAATGKVRREKDEVIAQMRREEADRLSWMLKENENLRLVKDEVIAQMRREEADSTARTSRTLKENENLRVNKRFTDRLLSFSRTETESLKRNKRQLEDKTTQAEEEVKILRRRLEDKEAEQERENKKFLELFDHSENLEYLFNEATRASSSAGEATQLKAESAIFTVTPAGVVFVPFAM